MFAVRAEEEARPKDEMTDVRLLDDKLVTVVVARVEVPVTARVPPTDWLPVIVEVPTVCVLAVKYVVTALVVVELPTIKLLKLASVATRDAKNPLVEVLLVEEVFEV